MVLAAVAALLAYVESTPERATLFASLGRDTVPGSGVTSMCPYDQAGLPSDFLEGCQDFIVDASNSCSACAFCANPGSMYAVEATGTNTQMSPYVARPNDGAEQSGYSVSTDVDIAGDPSDYSYMCMDWTVGSNRMLAAQAAYLQAENDDVIFGVGTDGCTQTGNMGGCYRITYGASGAKSAAQPKDLIVQAVNSGSDVACPQFDLQVGVGGQGANNNCVLSDASTTPMFMGTQADFGEIYGGWANKADCSKTPSLRYPSAAAAAGDDIIQLCELSFDLNLRAEGGANSRIIEMSQVTCPTQLSEITALRRADQDGLGFQHSTNGKQYLNLDGADCAFNTGSGIGTNCLSRMMDCRKPSAGFSGNVDITNLCAGVKVLPACTIDGYTRIVSDCGAKDCCSSDCSDKGCNANGCLWCEDPDTLKPCECGATGVGPC